MATPPVAAAKSPNAAPPLAADAPLPTATEPVASALVPMAMAVGAAVDAAFMPIGDRAGIGRLGIGADGDGAGTASPCAFELPMASRVRSAWPEAAGPVLLAL